MEAGRVKYTTGMMRSYLLSYFDNQLKKTDKYSDGYSWDDAFDFFQKNFYEKVLDNIIDCDMDSMTAVASIKQDELQEMFESAMEDACDDE